MRRQAKVILTLGGLAVAVFMGCASDPPAQQPQPYATGYPPQNTGYPPPNNGYPPPATAYPPATAPAPGYPPPGATPTAPPPAAPMATPGPLALPCQNDSACGLGRCNVQFQKCAFPCQTAADCSASATCNPMTGLCLPGAH